MAVDFTNGSNAGGAGYFTVSKVSAFTLDRTVGQARVDIIRCPSANYNKNSSTFQYYHSNGSYLANGSIAALVYESDSTLPGCLRALAKSDGGERNSASDAGVLGEDITNSGNHFSDAWVVVCRQYNPNGGGAGVGRWEIWEAPLGGSAAFQVGYVQTLTANCTPPTHEYFGARADLDAARFYRSHLYRSLLFNSALTAAEIAEIAASATGLPTGKSAVFDLRWQNTATVTDSSGNGNTATRFGATGIADLDDPVFPGPVSLVGAASASVSGAGALTITNTVAVSLVGAALLAVVGAATLTIDGTVALEGAATCSVSASGELTAVVPVAITGAAAIGVTGAGALTVQMQEITASNGFCLGNVNPSSVSVNWATPAEPAVSFSIYATKSNQLPSSALVWGFAGRFSGVNGLRPLFRLDVGNFWNASYPLACWYSYSESGPYYQFPNSTLNGSYSECQLATVFTSDTVYIWHSIPTTTDVLAAWVTDLLLDSRCHRLPSDIAYTTDPTPGVLATVAGSTTYWGKTIPALPQYGFRVSDDSVTPVGGKRRAILLGGLHAGEYTGPQMLRGFVEWLLAGSDQSDDLLEQWEFLVYPLLNVNGVWGGHYRSSFEVSDGNTTAGQDPNRTWDVATPALTSVANIRAAIMTDVPDGRCNLFSDWHSYTGDPAPTAWAGENLALHVVDSLMTAARSYDSEITSSIGDVAAFAACATRWADPDLAAYPYLSPVEAAFTWEFSTRRAYDDADAARLAAALGKALLARTAAGDYSALYVVTEVSGVAAVGVQGVGVLTLAQVVALSGAAMVGGTGSGVLSLTLTQAIALQGAGLVSVVGNGALTGAVEVANDPFIGDRYLVDSFVGSRRVAAIYVGAFKLWP